MLDRLFTNINFLGKGIDASWKRNEALANNIANAETPGYKRKDLEFESVLRNSSNTGDGSYFYATNELSKGFKEKIANDSANNSIKRTNNSQIHSTDSGLEINNDTSIKTDGNNVDIDYEMTELAKNAILYDSLVYSISKEIGRIKYIIREGR